MICWNVLPHFFSHPWSPNLLTRCLWTLSALILLLLKPISSSYCFVLECNLCSTPQDPVLTTSPINSPLLHYHVEFTILNVEASMLCKWNLPLQSLLHLTLLASFEATSQTKRYVGVQSQIQQRTALCVQDYCQPCHPGWQPTFAVWAAEHHLLPLTYCLLTPYLSLYVPTEGSPSFIIPHYILIPNCRL